MQVVADLLPKPATKLTVSTIVDFVANLSPVLATVDFVASVYRALEQLELQSGPKKTIQAMHSSWWHALRHA